MFDELREPEGLMATSKAPGAYLPAGLSTRRLDWLSSWLDGKRKRQYSKIVSYVVSTGGTQ